MSKSVESFLKFISLDELDYWDVKRYTNNDLLSFDNAILLRNILTYKKESISKDLIKQKRWQIISKINFSGELFLRDFNEVDIYKGNLYKVPYNSIIYSKINVRHGCIYYHEDDKVPFAVSSEYPTFVFDDKKVNGYYLKLVLRSNSFRKLLDTKTSGISKARVKVDEFLNIKIPLPDIDIQNQIVKKYNTKIQLAEEQEKEAKEIKESIEKYLFDELGIKKIEKKVKNSKLQFIESKDIDRWDTLFLIGKIPTLKAKYPIIKFSNIITHFNMNENKESLRINSKNYPDKDFIYIGMEHIEKETGTLLSLHNVKGEDIKSQTIKVPNNYLLFGKLRPYLNKYWINELDKNNIICSSEFFVFDIDKKINKLFFKYCLSSNFIQMQITDKTSGARMPRINEATFMSLDTPIPPINIQNTIATEITKRKEKIKHLKQQAFKNRENAIKEFEEEIFTK